MKLKALDFGHIVCMIYVLVFVLFFPYYLSSQNVSSRKRERPKIDIQYIGEQVEKIYLINVEMKRLFRTTELSALLTKHPKLISFNSELIELEFEITILNSMYNKKLSLFKKKCTEQEIKDIEEYQKRINWCQESKREIDKMDNQLDLKESEYKSKEARLRQMENDLTMEERKNLKKASSVIKNSMNELNKIETELHSSIGLDVFSKCSESYSYNKNSFRIKEDGKAFKDLKHLVRTKDWDGNIPVARNQPPLKSLVKRPIPQPEEVITAYEQPIASKTARLFQCINAIIGEKNFEIIMRQIKE